MIKKFENPVRCKCRNILNKRICLRKCRILYLLENKLYCNNHYQYYMNVYVIKLQSLWRGFKQRRIINIIYKRLPLDLQYKILYFVKRDTYQKRYIKKIKDIVEKRINSIPSNLIYNPRGNIANNYIIYNNDYILHVCRLYNKYYKLIDIHPYKPRMIELVKKLENLVNGMAFIRNLDATPDEEKIKKLYNTYVLLEWLIRPNRL